MRTSTIPVSNAVMVLSLLKLEIIYWTLVFLRFSPGLTGHSTAAFVLNFHDLGEKKCNKINLSKYAESQRVIANSNIAIAHREDTSTFFWCGPYKYRSNPKSVQKEERAN